MSAKLLKILTNLEAYHLAAAKEAAKAKKLVEGETIVSPSNQRGSGLASEAVAKRMKHIFKK